jgi:hypothetical protein
MTTDTGIDLVAFSPLGRRAVTIQVKANAQPKPGGGKGKLALDWYVAEDCPAELTAFVDLSTTTAWLMSATDVASLAQQRAGGKHHLYFYVDPTVVIRQQKPARLGDFDRFLFEQAAPGLFDLRGHVARANAGL